MFQSLSTKQKLFINMLVSQAGIITIGTLGYLGYGTLTIVTIVIFSILIGFFNYLVMDQTTKGIAQFEHLFDQFINFVLMKQNRLEKVQNVSGDEIGIVIQKVNSAIDTIEKNLQNDMRLMGEVVLTTDKAEQGIFNCRVKSDSNNPMLRTLKINVNKMLQELEELILQISTIAKAYANDDFTQKIQIEPHIKADMKVLLESVNKLGDSLANSAKSNLTNGQTLEQNANTMTESVNNLANKANQQAASLEETAAALEEITSITRNTASNALEMSKLGSEVQSEVQNGMSLASDTSKAMDDINTQVTSIHEAIDVIDQIAFQTNILSLNAAVEAATAGEAGKGFAVVAGEVRNLASRSAEAANEIKTIVQAATTKANDGKNISDKMIQGYEQLNERFSKTIELIEDVSSASKEQMQGIEQINDTVTMLDRVTQENANEASSVAGIAAEVNSMAQILVDDAKSKKF